MFGFRINGASFGVRRFFYFCDATFDFVLRTVLTFEGHHSDDPAVIIDKHLRNEGLQQVFIFQATSGNVREELHHVEFIDAADFRPQLLQAFFLPGNHNIQLFKPSRDIRIGQTVGDRVQQVRLLALISFQFCFDGFNRLRVHVLLLEAHMPCRQMMTQRFVAKHHANRRRNALFDRFLAHAEAPSFPLLADIIKIYFARLRLTRFAVHRVASFGAKNLARKQVFDPRR